MAKTKQGVRDLNNLGSKSSEKKHRNVTQEELAEVFCGHKFECQIVSRDRYGQPVWADVCENCGTQDTCHHQEDDNRDGNPG